MTETDSAPHEYAAAISYRRGDGGRFARRLRHALQRYRFPEDFKDYSVGKIYLDRAYQRTEPKFFERAIQPALDASHYMIVIITPSVAERSTDKKPNWVEREVEYFRSLGRADRILIARADDEPGSPLPSFLEDFDDSDQADLRGLSSWTPWRWRGRVSKPILGLIGKIADVPAKRMDEMREEERIYRRNRLLFALAATSVIAAVTLILAIVALVALRREARALITAQNKTIAALRATRAESAARRLAEDRERTAEEARKRESAAKDETRRNFARSDLATAIDLIERDRAGQALAYLARAVRTDPDNVSARSLLYDLLMNRNWPLATAAFRHPRAVRFAEITPRGDRVVTAEKNQYLQPTSVRVWNAEGVAIGRPVHFTGVSTLLRLSPSGKTAFAGSVGHDAAILDTRSGRATPWPPFAAPIREAVFHPTKELIAVSANDDDCAGVFTFGGVRRFGPFCHMTDPEPDVLPHREPRRLAPWAMAFSGDGRFLATAKIDIRIWDFEKQELVNICRDPGPSSTLSGIRKIVFVDDGQLLVLASDGARLWNVHRDSCTSELVSEAPDRSMFAVPRDDREISRSVTAGGARLSFWRRQRPSEAKERELPANIAAIDLTADGERVATASFDGTARLWSFQSTAPELETIEHAGGATDVTFAPSGQLLLTASDDGDAALWNVEPSRASSFPLHEGRSSRVMFTADGKFIVADVGHAVQVWDSRTGKSKTTIPLDGFVSSIALTGDSQRMAVGVGRGLKGSAQVWSLKRKPLTPPIRHPATVQDVHFTDMDRAIATRADDHIVRVFDAATGAPLASMKMPAPVDAIAARSDGLIAVAVDRTISLWNRKTNTVSKLRRSEDVMRLEFSGDGTQLLVSGGNGVEMWSIPSTSRLWRIAEAAWAESRYNSNWTRVAISAEGIVRIVDARTGRPASSRMIREERPSQFGTRIRQSRFSPDGNRIAVFDGQEISIWDVSSGRRLSTVLENDAVPNPFGNPFAFSPDGERLVVAADAQNMIAVWDVLTGTVADAPYLATLAEHVGGYQLDPFGQLVRIPIADRTIARMRAIPRPAAMSASGRAFAQWFFGSRARRRATPLGPSAGLASSGRS